MQKLRLPTKEEIEIYTQIKMDEKKRFYEMLDELNGVSPIASLKLPLIKSTSIDWKENYEDFFEGDGFHPNGDCGCFKARDNYMCGIRCDHLIVVDGSTEECVYQNEKCVWFDADKCDLLPDEKEYYNTHELFIKSQPAILAIGNHKGSLTMTKYVFAPSKTLKKCSIWYADIVRFANTKDEDYLIKHATGTYKPDPNEPKMTHLF
jgi:hypothetical protein